MGGLISFGGAYAGVKAALARIEVRIEHVEVEVKRLRHRAHRHSGLIGRLIYKVWPDMQVDVDK